MQHETANRYESADHAFRGSLSLLLDNGRIRAPRGQETVDIAGVDFTITDPRNRIVVAKDIRKGYAAASVLWNIAKRNDMSICSWNPNGAKISDDQQTFYGANYGQRWDGLLEEALEVLRFDPDSRRAFVPIWKPEDLSSKYSRNGLDVPCTIGFQLFIVESKLNMSVMMRSQSVFGVMPYDVFLFTALQELLANELGLELGEYHHSMTSCHVFTREIDAISNMLESSKGPVAMQPILTTFTQAKNMYPVAFEKATQGEVIFGDALTSMIHDDQ